MVRLLSVCAFVAAAGLFSARPAGADSPTTAPAAPAAPAATPAAAPTSAPDKSVTAAVGDTVSVHYTGKLEDGTVFDSSTGREPLAFTIGAGQMIPGFDKGVRGMALHEKKQLKLPPEDAYGQRDEKRILQVPIAKFGDDTSKLKVGMKVALGSPTGQRIPATIAKIEKETVTLDANHELAGKTLVFDVELVSLKKAGE
jgi:peptidylprolyl isomerase